MNALRVAFIFVVGGAWVAFLFAVLAPLAVLWPTRAWRNRLSLLAGRLWTRVGLRLCGVKIHYEGLENLRHPGVLTFNHSTYLDFMANSELVGSRCLVFGKRSLARLPFLGWGWLLGGHPLIRRDDRDHWQAQLDHVEHLLKDEGYSTIVAPEGKRSPTGKLLPFKKGPFHIALNTGLPIVPILIQGGEALLWERSVAIPGAMSVRVLPAIDTASWKLETLDDHVAEVRAIYLDALGQADADPT